MGPDGLPRLIADWDDKSGAALCMFGYSEVFYHFKYKLNENYAGFLYNKLSIRNFKVLRLFSLVVSDDFSLSLSLKCIIPMYVLGTAKH